MPLHAFFFVFFPLSTSQETIGNYSRSGKHMWAQRVCVLSFVRIFVHFHHLMCDEKIWQTVNGENRIANLWFECRLAASLVWKKKSKRKRIYGNTVLLLMVSWMWMDLRTFCWYAIRLRRQSKIVLTHCRMVKSSETVDRVAGHHRIRPRMGDKF